jgi:uncharacterized protein (UPF0261 family)
MTGRSRVALVGSLDTKGAEYAHLAALLRALDVEPYLIDTSVRGTSEVTADVDAEEVARAAGTTLAQVRELDTRGAALDRMSEGAAAILETLVAQKRIDGVMAMGGTGGTAVASGAFRGLPLGLPKIIVSTAASGDTRAYLGESDLVLIPSITDVAGLNHVFRGVLRSAAGAMAGMLHPPLLDAHEDDRPTLAASMFGVTTPCVDEARRLLDDLGFETLVFHMTGVGGRTLERLAREGLVEGVLDATTTELADELVGGVFSAGPERLTGAGAAGIPQVVSVGALDMVNFGAPDTVPERFAGRLLYEHNSSITLMRTTADECRELGRRLAERVRASTAPSVVFLPLRGVSMLAVEGGAFHDPEADAALFDAVRDGLRGSDVRLVEMDTDVNDPRFAAAMVQALTELLAARDPRA